MAGREHVERPEQPVPPPGEAIHLPGPSYQPALTALGISIAVVGIVMTWFLVAIGAVIAGYAVLRWIGETRAEMAELPLEH